MEFEELIEQSEDEQAELMQEIADKEDEYDRAKQLSEKADKETVDLDGDGVLKREDQWGFLTEGYNGYGMWAAGGHKITGIRYVNEPGCRFEAQLYAAALVKKP